MKYIMSFFIMLSSLTLFSQKDGDISGLYTGMYVSTKEGNFGFIQFENDINLAILRVEYLTNFKEDNRVYVKAQFQVYHTKNFRFFVALPPLHFSIKEMGYNTPLNMEILFKNKLILNVDVYRNAVNLSAQFRYKF